jgi:hypothetical protein
MECRLEVLPISPIVEHHTQRRIEPRERCEIPVFRDDSASAACGKYSGECVVDQLHPVERGRDSPAGAKRSTK